MSNREPRQIQCVLRDGSGNLVTGSLVYVLEGLYATDKGLQDQINAITVGTAIGIGNRYARVGTTDTSPGTYTKTGGSSGRGQITSADLVVDGITLANNDLVLVLYGVGSDKSANGLYTVTSAGSGSNGTWDRVSDMNADAEVTIGSMFTIKEGDTLKRTVWVVHSYNGVLGGASGDDILFVQVPTAANLTHILRLPGNHPDQIPLTPNAADDEFEGSSLDTGGTRFSGATAWSWCNQGGTSATLTKGQLVLYTNPADADSITRGIVQAAPTAPWKYRAKVCWGNALDGDSGYYGIFVWNGGSITASNSDNQCHLGLRWGKINVWATLFNTELASYDHHNWTYFEIENDGTYLYLRYSTAGVEGSYTQLQRVTIATQLSTVNYIGLGYNHGGSQGSAICTMVVDWFRRIS